jgi:hypothetical protein
MTVNVTSSVLTVDASALAGKALDPEIPARQMAFASVGI